MRIATDMYDAIEADRTKRITIETWNVNSSVSLAIFSVYQIKPLSQFSAFSRSDVPVQARADKNSSKYVKQNGKTSATTATGTKS